MKKAFTLIELLVVIAIIAILAAILFPVFAQAKLAAKKTTSVSNQKQIGLGMMMYAADSDDMYPRQDGCTLNSSMLDEFNNQPAGTNLAPWCNGSKNPGGYAFRDNHYNWQKWIQPYVKNKQMFFHPAIATIKGTTFSGGQYSNDGEIASGYALNMALTGGLNTWNYAFPYTNNGAIRDSFVGGTVTAIPAPAEAMIFVEQPFQAVTGAIPVPFSAPQTTLYPIAVREHWSAIFMTQGGAGRCGDTTTVDPKSVPFSGQVPVSYADGHTKTMPVGQFLANTPTAAQYGITWNNSFCTVTANYANAGTKPVWTGTWPMWGLN